MSETVKYCEKLNFTSYACHKGIAIFDEDENYDKFKLEAIVKANNDRINDTDEEVPIILGHTLDGQPETSQPPRVGYANNFHLIEIGKNNPRWAVASDFYVDDQYDLTEYKERSVELWTADNIIHPIALLKTSRPAKNLGVLNFKIENKDKLRKYIQDEEIEMTKEEIMTLVVDTLNASDLAAAVKSIMETQKTEKLTEGDMMGDPLSVEVEPELDEEGNPIEPAVDEEGNPIAEGEENVEDNLGDDTSVVEDEVIKEEDGGEGEGEVLKTEEGDGATPSGTNTFVPGLEEGEDEKKKKVEKLSMELVTQKSIADKYAAEFKKVSEERNDLVTKLIASNRSNELIKLSYEFGFDPDEEEKIVEGMGDAQYCQHINIIKSKYNKVPLNRGVVSPVKEIPDSSRLSQEKVLEIVKYATKNNVSFEKARTEVTNGIK